MRVTSSFQKNFGAPFSPLNFFAFQTKFCFVSKRPYKPFKANETKEIPINEFGLQDFEKVGLKEQKDAKISDFLNPIKLFNDVIKQNPKLKIEPELVNQKIHNFLEKLEEKVANVSEIADLEAINKFASTLRIPSETFWKNLYSSAIGKYQANSNLDQKFFHLFTNEILHSSDSIRTMFGEHISKMLQNQLQQNKFNFFIARKNLAILYKQLIFRVGYDQSLKLDAQNEKEMFDQLITPDFLSFNQTIFPYVRRNFQALSISEKIWALHLYSCLFHNTKQEKEIHNLLKRVSKSLSNKVERLSCLQLVILTQIFVRSNYKEPEFWKALEKYILFRLETDFTVNYLIKYLQGFAHFKTGSLDFYMEIDRYIGFHAEELASKDIHPLVKIYVETGKGRHKLFSLLELKIMQFKNKFSLNEVIDFLHSYALLNYLTPKLFIVLETKIIDQLDTLDEVQVFKVIDSLRMWKNPSPLLDLLKPRIHEILKSTDSENFLICIATTYLEEGSNQIWYKELNDKVRTFLGKKSAEFLLKLGGLLTKVSKKIFDEDVYKTFGSKCKELEGSFKGKEQKDIQYILWKLSLNE